MSGIDEQKKDIPKCPLCGKIPDYWTIYVESRPCIWLFSENYYETLKKVKQMRGEISLYRHSGANPLELEFTHACCMGGCSSKIQLDSNISDDDFHESLREVFHSMYSNYHIEVI